MRTSHQLCLLITVLGMVLCRSTVATELQQPDVSRFLKSISGADRVVVRDGGMDCCGPTEGDAVFYSTTNRAEILRLHQHLRFAPDSAYDCLCCGRPGIDWYDGTNRLALTSLKHGEALWWKGSQAAVSLTHESQAWVMEWLARHGVPGPKAKTERDKMKDALAEEADVILERTAPALFAALAAADEEAARTGGGGPAKGGGDFIAMGTPTADDDLKAKYIKAFYPDERRLHETMFRVLGILPMRWVSCLFDSQEAASMMLKRPLWDELDPYLQEAARSTDAAVRRGAARFVMTQIRPREVRDRKRRYEGWLELVVDEAYADPFPGNRRLVTHRILRHPRVKASRALRLAAGDADPTVRRRALAALVQRRDAASLAFLETTDEGEVRARKAVPFPKDYGPGTFRHIPLPGTGADTQTNENAGGLPAPATE